MPTPGPNDVAFSISGPIARADLPGLCKRVGRNLGGPGSVARCDVAGVEPDAVCVDALARLQLAARRRGCRVVLCNASADLVALVRLMGLANVLPADGRAVVSALGASGKTHHVAHLRPGVSEPPEVVYANGVDLCVQTFGERGAPVILLIAGAASSMDWWEDELCEQLAAGGRFVIRYDHRDTGQSVTCPPGEPDYDADDLVFDAVGVLDALGVPRAHVVGISMGGGIALRLALEHADRVSSLTAMSISPGSGEGEDALPPMSDELARSFAEPAPAPDWSNREEVIDYVAAALRPLAGSTTIADEDARELVARVVARTRDVEASMTNHWIAAARGGDDSISRRLGSIAAPTLILHGTEDPLFPYAHAEALAEAIPGSSLVPLEGVGHEHPPREVWPRFIGALLAHTADDRV